MNTYEKERVDFMKNLEADFVCTHCGKNFGNYLGRAGVLRMPSIEVFVVNENKKILNEKSLCQIVRNVVIK